MHKILVLISDKAFVLCSHIFLCSSWFMLLKLLRPRVFDYSITVGFMFHFQNVSL